MVIVQTEKYISFRSDEKVMSGKEKVFRLATFPMAREKVFHLDILAGV